MNMKSISLALALGVSGPAMAMAVDHSESGLSRLAHSIATFQSKSKAFVWQEETAQGTAEADRVEKNEVQPAVLIDSIPEPETWALMAAGLGALVLATRRRRR